VFVKLESMGDWDIENIADGTILYGASQALASNKTQG
jgi:hypothetical protein